MYGRFQGLCGGTWWSRGNAIDCEKRLLYWWGVCDEGQSLIEFGVFSPMAAWQRGTGGFYVPIAETAFLKSRDGAT